MEPRALAGLAPARGPRARRASSPSCATSTTSTATSPRCGSVDFDPSGFWWLEPNDADNNVVAFCARLARRRADVVVRRRNLSPVPRDGLPRRRCRAPGAGARCSTPTPSATAARRRQLRRRRGRGRARGTASPQRRADAPAARRRSGWSPRHDGGARYPWERPLGATPVGDGLVEFRRLGAAGASDVRLRLRGARPRRSAHEGYGVCAATVPAAHGDDYAVVLDGARAARPVLALAARRAARALARASTRGALAVDRRRAARRRRWRTSSSTSCTSARSRAEGTFDAAIPHLAELRRARRHRDRAHAGRPSSRAARLGLRRRLPRRPRSRPTAGPRASQRLVDAAHARGPARCSSTSSTTTSAPRASKALERLRPLLHRRYETFWGKAINYDDAGSRPGARVGRSRAPRAGCATCTSTACASTRSTRSSTRAPEPIAAPSSPTACTRRDHRRAGDRRVAASTTRRSSGRRPRAGWGCDAAWADDFHHALRTLRHRRARAATTRSSARSRDLAKAFRRPFVHDGSYSAFRRRRFGAPAPRPPAEQFVVFDQNHDQVGNRALGDRLPARGPRRWRRSARCCRPFTPMLFMGEEYGERAPFQFFTDHIDERDRRRHPRGAPPRVRRLRRVRGRGGPRPAGPRDVRALEAHAATATPALRELYGAPARGCAASSCAGDAGEIACDEDGRWLVVAPRRRTSSSRTSPAGTAVRRAGRARRCASPPTTRDVARRHASRCPRWPARCVTR